MIKNKKPPLFDSNQSFLPFSDLAFLLMIFFLLLSAFHFFSAPTFSLSFLDHKEKKTEIILKNPIVLQILPKNIVMQKNFQNPSLTQKIEFKNLEKELKNFVHQEFILKIRPNTLYQEVLFVLDVFLKLHITQFSLSYHQP